jgi:acyl dehydratase
VIVGDRVTLRGRCTAVEGPVVKVELEALNQRGEEVLKGASAEAVF